MKYFVISDVHSFYSAMHKALSDAGYFAETGPKKLVLCGDAFDRGDESVQMVDFLYDEHMTGRLIYVNGNHEELLQRMLKDFAKNDFTRALVHMRNGTLLTAYDLAGGVNPLDHPRKVQQLLQENVKLQTLLSSRVNYFETDKYVFVHGWIPTRTDTSGMEYVPNNWRDGDWMSASWKNGMEQWASGLGLDDKTVVCGHWHTSWGHVHLHGEEEKEFPRTETNVDGDPTPAMRKLYSPFIDKNIIALDSCVAYSGFCNCVVLEDEELTDE